ncbi:FadR/GntR family transcriptional regulator [Mixta intestinalis]|jgi:GntR family uxuAB operon transcriptional repressor|uniref:HTH-type transcriptional regulator LutR n=1 Tax=Mixta intestinalis TaxID=1615494 RepID=A0A6P1Q5Q8_9GAMM|nr:FadR/GntR family transcriptional regulator [Mixta intestinalis]QHM73407.1 HTH-type transcriptional regulator LutR [Mixta intestinalis]
MTLPAVKTERLYRQISGLLSAAIARGEFAPGSPLPPERELARQLNVSRSSVREALIALEVTGWVVIRSGNGVLVADPLPIQQQEQTETFSLRDLIKARQHFEAMTAELAARYGSDEQRRELQDVAAQLGLHEVNNAAFLAQDQRFHLLISEMSGNEVLRDMMAWLWNLRKNQRFILLESHFAERDFPRELNHDHQLIAEAIIDQNPALARDSMALHLQHVYDHLFPES